MSRLMDLSGQTFGRLTVLDRCGKTSHGNAIWRCRCECGAEIQVAAGQLRAATTRSCGCLSVDSRHARVKPMVGRTFGNLTVVSRIEKDTTPIKWNCQCECGKTTLVVGSKLRNGHTRSCGCLSNQKWPLAKRDNLEGRKFGRLTVIGDVDQRHHQTRWRCLCECGTERIISAGSLKCGQSQSCGCLHKERTSQKNLVDLSGKIFMGWTVLGRAANGRRGETRWLCSHISGLRRVRSYWNLVSSTDPQKKLIATYRRRMLYAFKKALAVKTEYSLTVLGCTGAELVAHLESQFEPGMALDNHGSVWVIDHVKPVASFSMHDPAQVRACFRYSNLQPLFREHNSEKSDRLDWVPHRLRSQQETVHESACI